MPCVGRNTDICKENCIDVMTESSQSADTNDRISDGSIQEFHSK